MERVFRSPLRSGDAVLHSPDLSGWRRGTLPVLVAALLVACFSGMLAALVFGFSPDSPLSPADMVIPLLACASGMILSGAALCALGRGREEGDGD